MPVRGRLPTEEDIPRTPGRDLMDRPRGLGKSQSTDTVPVTPGSCDTPLTGNSLARRIFPAALSLTLLNPLSSALVFLGLRVEILLSPQLSLTLLLYLQAFPFTGRPRLRAWRRSLSLRALLSASPQASLQPNNVVSSPISWSSPSCCFISGAPLPPQGSSPNSVEASSPAAPKDLPVPMIDVPVPLDTTSNKRNWERLKSKKVPVATPLDSEEPPAPVVASSPPDLPVNDLYPGPPFRDLQKRRW